MKSASKSIVAAGSTHTARTTISIVMSTLRSFVMRHRVSIQDLSLLVAVLLVGLYLAFDIDIFVNQNRVTQHQQEIELDEALALGGLLSVGLLFVAGRYREQKNETRRRITAEQYTRTLAFQDPLTGLPNRRQFDDGLKAALAAPPSAEATHAVLLLDLNGFKRVNDGHGHGAGDDLLTIVSQRLASSVREGDLVARLGGDEFAILALHLLGAEAATNIARRVMQALEDPITAGGPSIRSA